MRPIPELSLINLSEQLKKSNKLDIICDRLLQKHNLIITIGVELEFYLSHNIIPAEFSELIGLNIKHEKGTHQFEIDLPPMSNLTEYAEIVDKTKQRIIDTAIALRGTAHLSPKPFPNDYGNSMHVHISFDKTTKELLNHAAKSLCHFMIQTFMIFMPTTEDYLRINQGFMAPTCVAYGNNNRTVAVRMPDLIPSRLEHRVPSTASDPYLVMFTILRSIVLGLDNPSTILDIPKIYGNAYEDQYKLQALPKCLEEAKLKFNRSFFEV